MRFQDFANHISLGHQTMTQWIEALVAAEAHSKADMGAANNDRDRLQKV